MSWSVAALLSLASLVGFTLIMMATSGSTQRRALLAMIVCCYLVTVSCTMAAVDALHL